MSGAPTGFTTPKTNWATTDPINPADLNRIEGNPNAIETGERTLNQALANPANVGTLRQILSWFAGRIRAITGATNWWDAPATTLAAASAHHAAATPHAGHATTAALDGHAAATTAHSAVSTATASRIILRDANGRAQVADGVVAADIATFGQLASASGIPRIARTSNVQLVAADRGRFIDITSGTFTQTFAAASVLGAGWFCYVRNSGTGDITLDPNAAEAIDGLTTFVMYPGETRLITCDGAALFSVVLNAFTRTFLTSGTFVRPPGYQKFYISVLSGGNGGGEGDRQPTGSNSSGGSSGAGGGLNIRYVLSEGLNLTESVVVGAGGVGRPPLTTDNSSGHFSGTQGGTSSLGPVVSVAPSPSGANGLGGAEGGGLGLRGGAGAPVPAATTGIGNPGSSNPFGGGSSGGFGGSLNHDAVTASNGGTGGGIGGGTGGVAPGGSGGSGVGERAAGGGGASSLNSPGGAGGNAAPNSGSGGGGGGASRNGFNSGAGGNGGSGRVTVMGVV